MSRATPRTTTDGDAARPSRNSNGADRLLALLQLTNAAFPTGAFTHSHGFETWIDAGTLASGGDAEALCRDWLRFNLATCDAVAVALVHRDLRDDRVDGIAVIDRRLGALKLSREARAASAMMGAALIAAGRDIFALPEMTMLGDLVRTGACDGHHAVAYGVICEGLGLSEEEAVTSFLWSGLAGLVAVVQRLLPMAQTEAQRIIAAATPLIGRCCDIARGRDLDGMAASFVALEVAAMRHERLPTRLCIS